MHAVGTRKINVIFSAAEAAVGEVNDAYSRHSHSIPCRNEATFATTNACDSCGDRALRRLAAGSTPNVTLRRRCAQRDSCIYALCDISLDARARASIRDVRAGEEAKSSPGVSTAPPLCCFAVSPPTVCYCTPYCGALSVVNGWRRKRMPFRQQPNVLFAF